MTTNVKKSIVGAPSVFWHHGIPRLMYVQRRSSSTWPLLCWILYKKRINISAFSKIFQCWYSTGTRWKTSTCLSCRANIDGLVQDCSNPIANALELLQSCTEQPISCLLITWWWKEPWHQQQSYRQVSNIRCTKSQHFKDSRTVLRLSLPNPLKPDVKSRMKM